MMPIAQKMQNDCSAGNTVVPPRVLCSWYIAGNMCDQNVLSNFLIIQTWKRLVGHTVAELTYHEGKEVCDRGDRDGTASFLHGQPHPFVQALLLHIHMFREREIERERERER